MHVLQFEINKPTDESAFEDMCARVYGTVFGDPLPKVNGRNGQAQAGIDVFVNSTGGRVGIQCKRYVDGALTFRHVEQEVRRADNAATPIARLIVATTAARDAKLLRKVQDFSDARGIEGKYTVEVEFWDDVCGHIRGSGMLQNDYSPNAPGALFHRQSEQNFSVHASLIRIESRLDVGAGLPGGRPDSVNMFLTSQLDSVNDLLKACRFRDANEDLARLGKSLELFDDHQRARWYLQRGLCTWHLDSGKAAAPDFLKAFEVYPGDEKMAAAGVRGLFLQDNVAGAIESGAKAMDLFPMSVHVWLAFSNARMVHGDELTMTDVPLAMRENCDVLQLLAWARKKAGDLAGAIELSSRALTLPEAGFFTRGTALALALEAAADDPVKLAYGLVGANEITALQGAVAALQPRKERLWSVQSVEALADVLAHLGHANIVLGRSEDALDLVDEAKHAGMLSPRLMRVALEAYRRLDRLDELLRHGREWIADLEEEALVQLAEAGAEVGDVGLVIAVAEVAKKVTLSQPETPHLLTAIRWIALWRSKDGGAQAVSEAKAADLSTCASLAIICGGARVLFAAGEESDTEAAIKQACSLVTDASPAPVRLALADLLYTTENYSQAIPYYERIMERGRCSDLHGRLLTCYVRTGARRKGRELLQSFPDGWASDDRIRELAMRLGQQAADWSFLVPLAELQCERAPDAAGAWLLRLMLDHKTKKMHRFHHALEAVPAELKGGHRQLAQVAAFEMRFGNKARGMCRLYRLFRRHMDDLDAASSYFIGIIAAPGELPDMEEKIAAVTAGTTVELAEELGGTLRVSIDPNDTAPLPQREGFYHADSEDVAPLMGASVGTSVELPGPFKTSRKYVIKSITSVHRHLLKIAQKRFQSSMSAKGIIMSVPLPETATGADFSHMHEMLKRHAEHSRRALDMYVNGPLTLGILAKLLGRSVTEIPSSWPADGPQLFVCAGTQNERVAAAQLLQRREAVYVVDAVTIAELVYLGCEQVLAVLPKVLVSTKTLELLEARLEDAKTDQSGGQVFDDEGAMRFIEFTDEDKRRRVAQYQTMVDVAQRNCEVVPAYGPEVIPQGFDAAESVLEDEEHSALLLAVERGATLFTLDGRLAQLAAETLGLTRVWPQSVIRYAAETCRINGLEYSLAVIRQFLGNRTFVSLSPRDLVFMCLQGGHTLRAGVQRFNEHLANPTTDFRSATDVMFQFLELQAKCLTQFKAFTELLCHMLEASLRHPACPSDAFMSRTSAFAADIILTASGEEQAYPDLEEYRRRRLYVQGELLQETLLRATALAKEPVKRRAVKLKTLKCTQVPILMFDGAVPEPDAEGVTLEVASPVQALDHGAPASSSTNVGPAYLISLDSAPDTTSGHVASEVTGTIGAQ